MVFPTRYTYETAALLNPSVDDNSNCSQRSIGSSNYTLCAHPIVLTDRDVGLGLFANADSNSYYRWDKANSRRILFTFSESVLLSAIQLHFYVDSNNGIGLPKLRISLVNDTFQVADPLNGISSATVDPITITPELNGVQNTTAILPDTLQFNTSQILLRIESNKRYELALTEIKFCSGRKLRTSLIFFPYKIML